MLAFPSIYVFITKYCLNLKSRDFFIIPLKTKFFFPNCYYICFVSHLATGQYIDDFKLLHYHNNNWVLCAVSWWVFYLYESGCGFAGHCHCQRPSDTGDTCGGKTGRRWHTGISQPLQQEEKARSISLSQCEHLMAKLFIVSKFPFFVLPLSVQ